MRSTLVGSWLCELAAAGALSGDPDAVVLSEAAGTQELYDLVVARGWQVRPVGEVTRPDVLAAVPRLVAVNSALQVDLTGQVNAEELAAATSPGGRAAGLLRAAQRSPAGWPWSCCRPPHWAAGSPASSPGCTAARSPHPAPGSTSSSPSTARPTSAAAASPSGPRALTAIAAPEHRDSLGDRT